MIVTFGCQSDVYVYEASSGVRPMWPYKTHSSVDKAKEYLKAQGKKSITVIVKK